MPDQPLSNLPPQDPPPEREPDILQTTRASHADRDAVNRQLQDAFADGRLDEDEFDVRMQRALTARTRGDLDRLLVDLGLPQPRAGAPIPAMPSSPATTGGQYTSNLAILSSINRKGRWMVPEQLTATAILGDVKLDLRAATLSGPVTTIKAQAVLGEIQLIVPPGVRVEVNASPILGEVSNRVHDADLPADAPVVRVDALSLLGEFTAKTKTLNTAPKWWNKLLGG